MDCFPFPFLLYVCLCCRLQREDLPLYLAALHNNSEAVIKALLDAYPDAAKKKAKEAYCVRCGRKRRVFCPLFSHSSRVCCRVQDGKLPLHFAAQSNESEAVIKALLDAYPDAVKEKDKVRCGRGRRVFCPLLSLLTCVCCRVQDGYLPLHLAAYHNESEAVIKALLDAYPDAAKEKAKVRCGRVRRLLCPLLSLLTCVCVAVCSLGSCRSTWPLGTTSQRR